MTKNGISRFFKAIFKTKSYHKNGHHVPSSVISNTVFSFFHFLAPPLPPPLDLNFPALLAAAAAGLLPEVSESELWWTLVLSILTVGIRTLLTSSCRSTSAISSVSWKKWIRIWIFNARLFLGALMLWCTGWPFRLCQTSYWQQNKGCALVQGPHTKTQLLCWEVWHNLNGHPVDVGSILDLKVH